MLGRRTAAQCMTCKTAIDPGMFTCGEEACELAALEGQAMLAPLIIEQEVRIARKIRFLRPLPVPNLEAC